MIYISIKSNQLPLYKFSFSCVKCWRWRPYQLHCSHCSWALRQNSVSEAIPGADPESFFRSVEVELICFFWRTSTGHTDFTMHNKNLINFWYVKTLQSNYKQISIHIKVIEAWFIFHPLPSMKSICLEKTHPKQRSSMIVIKFRVPAQEILNYPILIRLFLLSGDRKINI